MRSHLINALLFQLVAELLVDIFREDHKDYTHLILWARRYGLILQLVNDNNDYLPLSYGYKTTAKKEEDTARNEEITKKNKEYDKAKAAEAKKMCMMK